MIQEVNGTQLVLLRDSNQKQICSLFLPGKQLDMKERMAINAIEKLLKSAENMASTQTLGPGPSSVMLQGPQPATSMSGPGNVVHQLQQPVQRPSNQQQLQFNLKEQQQRLLRQQAKQQLLLTPTGGATVATVVDSGQQMAGSNMQGQGQRMIQVSRPQMAQQQQQRLMAPVTQQQVVGQMGGMHQQLQVQTQMISGRMQQNQAQGAHSSGQGIHHHYSLDELNGTVPPPNVTVLMTSPMVQVRQRNLSLWNMLRLTWPMNEAVVDSPCPLLFRKS
jgi:hypothetical protein